MCGIAGVAGPPGVASSDFRGALDCLQTRGPDGSAVSEIVSPAMSCTLLHTRLAINDLTSDAIQPMSDERGRFTMTFNGEIYNSPELRQLCEQRGHHFRSRMDGEVILHLFEDEGTAAFARLNGIFAVAIFDSASGNTVLARDPLGVKPLFYSVNQKNALYFASELRALAALGAPLMDYDLTALAQFLTFLWIPAPRTPFSGAHALRPGEMLQHTKAGYRVSRFSKALVPSDSPTQTADIESVTQGRELFAAATRRQLQSEVPVGLMASGGVDSGLIWWAAHDSLARAFTVSWTENTQERLNDDIVGVRRLERQFGTPVTELPGELQTLGGLPAGGDLFADPAFALTRAIAQVARRQGVPVLLAGQGGDELFGGYRRHQMASLLDRVRLGRGAHLSSRLLSRMSRGSTGIEYSARAARAFSERDAFRGYMQLCTYSTAEERARTLGCTTDEVSDDVVWEEHQRVFDTLPPRLSFARKAMTVDLNVYLPGLGLAYVDRAGMEFGVEIRVPWLDLELVRWSLELPMTVLVRRGSTKWLTRQIAGQVLPAATARGAKRGFGAPAAKPTGAQGKRGFRQGSYFVRATEILEEHRATVGRQLLAR